MIGDQENAVAEINVDKIRYPTVSESLSRRKAELERELAEVNDTIAAMEAYPSASKLIDQLAKMGALSRHY